VAGVAGQLIPIPGASYGRGTMTLADLYPSHVGIGGIRSSDWSIPAFADAAVTARENAHAIGDAPRQVNLTTPAGWLALFLVILAVGSLVIRR
jgi:hypothetical protein